MISNGLAATVDVIIRPSACLARISGNPERYFRPTLVLIVIIAALPSLSSLVDSDPSAWYDLLRFPHTFVSILTVIVTIFWLGKKFGGSGDFRKAFSTLSYCLIPIAIAFFAQYATEHVVFAPDDQSMPIQARDFAGFSATIIYSTVIPVVLVVWMAILHVKALMITNGFGAKKSILFAILGYLTTYPVMMVYSLITLVIFGI